MTYLVLLATVTVIAGLSGYGLGTQDGYAQGFDSGYQRGGEASFERGLVTGSMLSHAVEGAGAAHVSEMIRKGDTLEAIEFLEGTVDGSLLGYSGIAEIEKSPFDRTDWVARTRRVMERVAEHRATHPTVSDNPELRETIEQALASLRPAKDER